MHPARRSRQLPPAQDLTSVIAGAEETRARIEQVLEQVVVLASRPYAPGAYATANAGLRQAGNAMTGYVQELSRISAEKTLNEMEAAVERGAGFRQGAMASGGRQRASRHRKPGRGQLALISGGAVAAGIVAGTISTGGFSDLANLNPLPVAHHAVSSLPDLGPASAIPIVVPPVQQGYAPRHAKPSAEASTASPVVSSAPVIVVATPSSQPPSPQPSVAPDGTLNVSTVSCDASVSGGCQIIFSAVGAALQWHATASDPALSLSSSDGILGGGQPAVITVTVAPGSPAGTGTVTLAAGTQVENVQVRWESVPG